MLSTHFIRRGYPKRLVVQAIDKCLNLNREDLLNQDLLKQQKNNSTENKNIGRKDGDTFYCITTHNPQNPNIKSVIKNHWDLLQKTKTTRHLDDAKLIFGLRRNKNLSDQLVKASTRTIVRNRSFVDKHPCNRPSSCRYCCRLNTSGTVISTTTGKKFTSMKQVNCQSSNLIYLITCIHCNIQYVGQTKNRLLTRFQGHYFDINSQNDTTVARHFNKCPSISPAKFHGLSISVLSFINKPADSTSGQTDRDREEKRWIHRLESVVPKGLNLMD